jgi:hypothetical protein
MAQDMQTADRVVYCQQGLKVMYGMSETQDGLAGLFSLLLAASFGFVFFDV